MTRRILKAFWHEGDITGLSMHTLGLLAGAALIARAAGVLP